MLKEKDKELEDETIEELEAPEGLQDDKSGLQLTNIENQLNDIKGTLDKREALAHEALIEEVDVEIEEPKKKFSGLKIISAVVVVGVVVATVMNALKPKNSTVSQSAEVSE